MADEVRNYLTSEIETLRSAVFRAGVLNAKTLRPCASVHLENVLRYVTGSHELEEATYVALSRTTAFARALYAQAQVAEIEQARREALVAIDAFGVVVEGALAGGTSLVAGLGDAGGVAEPMVRVAG